MASLCQGTASHCNDSVAFKKAVCKYFINKDVYFCFGLVCPPVFANKATTFLTTSYTGKYWLVVKNFGANENAALSLRIF